MKRKFDVIAYKRKVQQEIYEEIKDLSPEEQVEYFHKAGEKFWREIETMRKDDKKARQSTKSRSTRSK
ncbi:MAG TPA: hypothetical protein VJ521_13310 [Acidobacteriota bacterium]|nr:hypothetical protein [Acidobacteriota bacterium]